MQDSWLTTLLPMSLSAIAAAWAMLALLGGERERRMREEKNRPVSPPAQDPAPAQKPAATPANARAVSKNAK